MKKTLALTLLALLVLFAVGCGQTIPSWGTVTKPVWVVGDAFNLPRTGTKFAKCAEAAADGTTRLVDWGAFKRSGGEACETLLAFSLMPLAKGAKLAKKPKGANVKVKLDPPLGGQPRTGKVRK